MQHLCIKKPRLFHTMKLYPVATLISLSIASAYVHADDPFVILYQQAPLSQAQADRLAVVLERSIEQRPLMGKKDNIIESVDEADADLLLLTASQSRKLTSSKRLVTQWGLDWPTDQWQYIDYNVVQNGSFYPLLVDFTSLAINSDMLPASLVKNWSDAWDSQWSQQIAVSNDYQQLFVVALTSLGYSTSTRNPVEIHSAYKLLQRWLPNIREISSQSDIEMAFLSGEIVLGTSTNRSAYSAAQEGSPIKMMWTMDPIVRTTYGASIPLSAQEMEDSLKAIQWLATPLNAAEYAYSNQSVSAITATNQILPEAYVNDSNLYPPKAATQVRYSEFLGDSALYQDYFDELCAEHGNEWD